jgi:UDP-glucose 4-epimerase
MNYIITGGCGFVGSNLVDILLKQGHKVIIIDDMSSGKYTNESAETHCLDIQNIMSFRPNIRIDAIFHLAAEARIQPSFERPLRWQQANINGTAAVCEWARKYNCKVIYAGSSSCYGGRFMNPYTFSKKISEEMCEMYSKVYGVSTVTARFFNVYGPRNPLIGEYTPIIAKFEQLKKKGKPLTVVGDGEQKRDFTHVYDICEGLIRLSEGKWNGEVFNLGTGKNYSINELVKMFECEKIHLPARPGESRETKADISKTIEMVGWKPRYNLKDYIKEKINEL